MTALAVEIPGYVDLAKIGGGGSATVYRAYQPAFDRQVAIKILPAGADVAAHARFARECSALGALSGHPNIVTVYEMGTAGDGELYIVMEFLSGGSLADVLAAEGPLDWSRSVAIGVKLAGALESAHRAGVLHGDVKPENGLLSRFGEPKLADFGLAGVGKEVEGSLGLATTLAHAAPEMANGDRPSVTGDVYGLASTLHTLVAGRPPFVHADDVGLASVVARITDDPPPDLRGLGVPDRLCSVLEQGMAKDPEARQTDAAQLGRQLQAIQAGAQVTITPMLVEHDEGSSTAVFGSPYDELPGDGSHRRRQARRERQVLAAGLVLLAVAAVAWFVPLSPPPAVRLSQIYQDNFEMGRAWYELDDDRVTLAYQDGHYQLVVKQPHRQVISDTLLRGPVWIPLTNLRDVSVRVSARPVSGTGLFGIVCRQTAGAASYYEGLVGVDGTARIVKYDGKDLLTIGRGQVTVTPDRVMRLRLDCLGEPGDTTIRLFADGRKVAEAADRGGPARGSTGLVLATADAPSADVLFDDFVILGHSPARQ